jgi:ubiquinone/menaquinone biosynthesis C-methylase UbiE
MDYEIKGIGEEAIKSFGCGNPVGLSSIVPGDIVVDLGSGAGLDSIMAANRADESGRVVGIDLSDKMISKARENAEKFKLGSRVMFLKGDIENVPLEGNFATLVISNCVLALAPNKQKVFDEIYRILKPGGRFVISDIVSGQDIPKELVEDTDLYVSCVTGAAQVDQYHSMIRKSGFIKVEEVERHDYGNLDYSRKKIRMFSITVRGYK